MNLDEALASLVALIFGFTYLKGIYAIVPNMRSTLNTLQEIANHATKLLFNGLRS